MNILKLAASDHVRLWSHLLPETTRNEQAAFLFCKTAQVNGGLVFEAVDHVLLGPSDFAAQYADYIELSDEARIRLIKSAHHSGTSLAELHSHPGPWPAAFSISDRMGLKETVPHMRWRLKQRPYLAIVVAPSGFDALVWAQNAAIPEPLTGIDVDGTLMVPTNNSLEGWADE
jgi:proteasome lid subunit RPN8/RPN11